MTNKEHMERVITALEKRFGADVIHPYFWAFDDVVVLGHTSKPDDNAYVPQEQPEYDFYRAGALATEKLQRELDRVDPETLLPRNGRWRN